MLLCVDIPKRLCSTSLISNPLPLPNPPSPMTTTDTTNDHLAFSDLFDKATNYLLSVDALSSIDVPFKGETLRFTKNGNIISITSVK